MRKTRLILTFIVIFLFLILIPFIFANVNSEWDWNKPGTRILKYSFDPYVPEEWKQWAREAAQIINNASTGWILEEGELSGDNIKIYFFPGYSDAPGDTDWGDRLIKNDSRLTYRNIIISNRTNYGRTGDATLDPLWVMLHEMLHCLRLRHHDGNKTGIMNPYISWGDHNVTLSPDDIAQMEAANKSSVNVPKQNVTPSGVINKTVGVTDTQSNLTINITIPPFSVTENTTVYFHQWFFDSWDSKYPDPFFEQIDTDIGKVYFTYTLDIRTTSQINTMSLYLTTDESIPFSLNMAQISGQEEGTIARYALDEYKLRAFMYDYTIMAWNEISVIVNLHENRIYIPEIYNILPNQPNLIILAAPPVTEWHVWYITGRINPDYNTSHGSLYECKSSDGLTYSDCVMLKSCNWNGQCGYNFFYPRPFVLKTGSNYRMWIPFYQDDIWGQKIYHMQTNNLENWNVSLNLVINGVYEENRGFESVIYNGTDYIMFYYKRGQNPYPQSFVRRTSSDGINWNAEQIIFNYGTGSIPAPQWQFVISTNTTAKYVLFYLDPYTPWIVYRKSLDSEGLIWSAPINLSLSANPFTIQQDYNQIYLYYGNYSNIKQVELVINSSGDVSVGINKSINGLVDPSEGLNQFNGGVGSAFFMHEEATITCGDANSDGSVDISDAVYLISYIFSGGPAPNPLFAGDANSDGSVDISDAVYLIGYIFSGGPAPCTQGGGISSSSASLSFGSASGTTTKTIPVNLNNAENVAGLKMNLNYDPNKLTIQSITTSSRTSNLNLIRNGNTFGFANTNGKSIAFGNGAVVYIKVSAGKTGFDSSSLKISYAEAANPQAKKINVKVLSSSTIQQASSKIPAVA